MDLKRAPVAKVELLIRRPVADVYEAFVDPDVITRFWFSRTTGRLESGKSVEWHWEMFDMKLDVQVRELVENERILIDWGNAERRSTVEWRFTPRGEDTTYVSVTNRGFTGDGDQIVDQGLDSAAGFALVLAAAKAYLEHGIRLNVVEDRF